ncbi:hypothetical protein [Cryobacterium fucosi]|uniref:Uncharacterized protein n=1 Tax=Cryobacterium fucosi TaxID=1259157 RepID=A0A4R9B2X7_9MICO|nr:hypothetical protein [Cryobacterium fucosi]TFD74778.1 hypothetical protein E3T48_12725 [Cryobacterium fucosi]
MPGLVCGALAGVLIEAGGPGSAFFGAAVVGAVLLVPAGIIRWVTPPTPSRPVGPVPGARRAQAPGPLGSAPNCD